MAVPGPNQFTDPPIVTGFLPPLTDPYNPLTMRAPGGVAINDGSQGREVQIWTVDYDGSNIHVKDAGLVTRFTLAQAGVLTVCLAFDSNMAVALAFMKADGGYLYFFNSVTNAYQTNYYASITSCRVCVDKTSRFFEGQSDVIFAYMNAGMTLQYRIQRDRYTIEYTAPVSPAPTIDNPLIRFGPSVGNRLEFELFVFIPPPPPPPPPALGITRKLPLPTLPVVRVVKVDPRYN